MFDFEDVPSVEILVQSLYTNLPPYVYITTKNKKNIQGDVIVTVVHEYMAS